MWCYQLAPSPGGLDKCLSSHVMISEHPSGQSDALLFLHACKAVFLPLRWHTNNDDTTDTETNRSTDTNTYTNEAENTTED